MRMANIDSAGQIGIFVAAGGCTYVSEDHLFGGTSC